MDIERRQYGTAVEIRADGDGAGTIGGHSAVTGVKTPIWDFEELFEPGAFLQTIAEDDIRGLWNPESSFPLGRTGSGTLRLSEDDTGLAFENDLPAGFIGAMVLEAVQRGDITGGSIGFISIDEEWSKENGVQLRKIQRVKLFDSSPVTFPAYPETDVQARSLLASPGLPEEVRESLVKSLRLALPKTDGIDQAVEQALRGHVDEIARRVADMLKEERRLVVEAADRRSRSLQLADAEL